MKSLTRKLTYSELKAWRLDNPNLSFGDAGPSLSIQVDFSNGTFDRVVGNGQTLGERVKDVASFGFLPVGRGLGDFFGGIAVAKNTDYPLSIRSQAAFDAGANSLSLPAAALMVGGVIYGRVGPVAREMPLVQGLESRGLRPAPGTRVIPEGIPGSWRIRGTQGEGGIQYYNPRNPNENIRIMQGDSASKFQNSQVPYARQQNAAGTYLRQDGTPSPSPRGGRFDPDAHIPLDQFKAR